jgi:hypothetical protein
LQEALDELNLNLSKSKSNEDAIEMKKDIDSLEAALAHNADRQKYLGKNWSGKKFLDSLFTFIRFRGLGYNLNSYMTNFLEGQTANILADASGDYFNPGTIYRANNIVKGSLLAGRIKPKGAKLASVLMRRYDVLQDASNEMQKASRKSTLSSAAQNLTPYAGTQRVEYMNQTPIMISILMSTEINGVNEKGEKVTSSVWDAMKEDGTLKEEFNSVENNHNWVDGLGQDYLDFKGTVDKAIVNIHGDYHALKGNMATEYISGKALLMFKRWLSRQVYNRFALVEQNDLEAGIKDFKGRYISHDKISGLLHGAILGAGGLAMFSVGIPGMALGAAIGFGRGVWVQRNNPNKLGAGDSLKELAFLSSQILLNPFKFFVNNLVGKDLIKEGNFAKYLPNYSERDIKNIRTNIAEMSMTLLWLVGVLAAKAAFWDDDDEKDSANRIKHNLLVNRMMGLASSLALYNNPKALYDNITDPAILGLFKDIAQLGTDINDLSQGNDTVLSGPNAGESGLWNQTKKTFFPNILKGDLGFESQSSRQFKPSPYDSLFWGENKIYERKNRELRAIYRNKLSKLDLDKTIIDEAIKRRFPPKATDKSQKEWFESIKDNPIISLEDIKVDSEGKAIKEKKAKAKKRKRIFFK